MPTASSGDDQVRIRIEGRGREPWHWKVTDAATGRLIPVSALDVNWPGRNGVVTATITVEVFEFEAELEAEVVEAAPQADALPEKASLARYLIEHGFWVRARAKPEPVMVEVDNP
jgi:hypothetical protein